MDLTRFMHGQPERLAYCRVCGTIMRDERRTATYATDVYDPQLLDYLFPRYLQAFREKSHYRELLSPRAEVVELGSHIGAFLTAAEEWNWRPTGIDIGEYTSAFARRRGLRVKRASIDDSGIRSHSAEGVFVWNCFEQLENPHQILRSIRNILQPYGVLVIRTPNFEFYETARAHGALRELAFNNLLGFPYLIGYTPASLVSLVAQYGFEPLAGYGTTLLTMPFPELTPRLEHELAETYSPYRNPAPRPSRSVKGPWMEIAFRAA